MGIDAARFGVFSASPALHADPTIQSATRVEYTHRISELARCGTGCFTPMPIGSDREPNTVRFQDQHADFGSRERAAILDEDAGLTRT